MPNTRSRDAVIQLKARMHEPLRARLEKLAKQRGVSLNTELVDRIKESFAKEDSVGGPRRLQTIVRLITAAFILGGQRAAHRKHPKWRYRIGLNDPACYEEAASGAASSGWLLFMQSATARIESPWDKATIGQKSHGKVECDRRRLVITFLASRIRVMRGNITRRGKSSWRVKFDLGTDPVPVIGRRATSPFGASVKMRNESRRDY